MLVAVFTLFYQVYFVMLFLNLFIALFANSIHISIYQIYHNIYRTVLCYFLIKMLFPRSLSWLVVYELPMDINHSNGGPKKLQLAAY